MKSQNVTSKIKETISHGIYYGIGSSLSTAVRFLLIPIYVAYLTTTEYGIYSLLRITEMLLIPVFGLGISSAMFRSYFDYSKERNKRIVVGTSFTILILSSIIFIIVGFILSGFLSQWLFGTRKYDYLFILLFIAGAFINIKRLPFLILRARKEPKKYVALNVSFFIFEIILIIILVVVFNLKLFGIILGILITSILSAVILYIIIFKHITFKISKLETRKQIAYGYPFIFTAIISTLLTSSDRYILNYYTSTSTVGIYTLSYTIGMVMIVLFVSPIRLAWPPLMMSSFKDKNANRFYSKVLTYALTWGFFLFLTLSLFSPELIRLISPEKYWEGIPIVPLVAFSYLLSGVVGFIVVGIHKTRKTYWVFIWSVVGALLNIVLNIIFISRYPKHGIYIAAGTTLISFIVIVIICYFINQSLIKIKYELDRICILSAVAFALFIPGFFIPLPNTFLTLGFKSGLVILYILFLAYSGFLKQNEIDQIKLLMKTLKNTIRSK